MNDSVQPLIRNPFESKAFSYDVESLLCSPTEVLDARHVRYSFTSPVRSAAAHWPLAVAVHHTRYASRVHEYSGRWVLHQLCSAPCSLGRQLVVICSPSSTYLSLMITGPLSHFMPFCSVSVSTRQPPWYDIRCV